MKFGKCTTAILCITLMTGVFGGCGKKDSGSASQMELEKGRYVETEEALPDELGDWTVRQMFSAGEEIHLLVTRQDAEKTFVREWAQQGETFADVTQEWLAAMELPCGDGLEVQLTQDGAGVQYLYAEFAEPGDEKQPRGHLWRGDGAEVRDITPEKWTVLNEQWGEYEYILGVEAMNNGTLTVLSYTSVDTLYGEDGSVIESGELSTWYEQIFGNGENVYLCASDASGIKIEKRKEGRAGDAANLVFPTVGTGSVSFCALQDGTLIAAGADGIFRYAADSGSWEKLLNGMGTDFSAMDCWCVGLNALEDGRIYALFQKSEGGVILNKYEYDPEAVTEIEEELKVYTVYESYLLQQAAVMYHKEHPEILITIQVVYPRYYNGETDYNAVYQELNTMLMGENAPDILVMDHLDMDSFIKKGLLEDISDIVTPLEENGELLSNITGSYVQEDGSRYVAPLQFGFNMAVGRDIGTENMASLKALAEFLSQSNDNYMGDQTVSELVDKFYPYFCGEIVTDGQLNREKLGENLEYLKAIADNCGITDARGKGERCCNIWDMASEAKLAFETVEGFKECLFPIAVRDYVGGDFTAFENAFIPMVQTGICTKSPYADTAKDFLGFALSQSIQDTDYYNGFPINRVSLEKQTHKDRKEAEAYTTIEVEGGGEAEFPILDYSDETAEEILSLCKSLDRPVMEDDKIREVLIESLEGYLNGTQSKEETIQKIEGGLKMYLAE